MAYRPAISTNNRSKIVLCHNTLSYLYQHYRELIFESLEIVIKIFDVKDVVSEVISEIEKSRIEHAAIAGA